MRGGDVGADAGERDVGGSISLGPWRCLPSSRFMPSRISGPVRGADVTEGLAKLFLLCDPVFFVLSGYFAISGRLRERFATITLASS